MKIKRLFSLTSKEELLQLIVSAALTMQMPLLQSFVLQDLYIVFYKIVYMCDMYNSVG